jgi:hypothetical protein
MPGENPGIYPMPGENPGIYPMPGENPGIYPMPGENPGIYPMPGQNPGIYPMPGQNPGIYPMPGIGIMGIGGKKADPADLKAAEQLQSTIDAVHMGDPRSCKKIMILIQVIQ